MIHPCRAAVRSARVLCFAPHPDDEILGPGGTLLLHRRAGSTVQVVLATDGVAGDPHRKFDPTSYAERRRNESRRAAQVLGLDEPLFWGLPDSCEVVEADMVRLVGLVVERLQAFSPEIVYLPWQQDNHTDHLVLHEAVARALGESGFVGEALGYEVWAPIPVPDRVVDISDVVDEKRRALQCFETQYAYGDLGHQVFGMNAYRSLVLEKSGGYGEAFAELR